MTVRRPAATAARVALAVAAILAGASSARAQEAREVSLAYAAERAADGHPAHAGEALRVRGVATVDSKAFSSRVYMTYVQDARAGLCLFSRTRMEEVAEGDEVEAEGELQAFNGTPQLVLRRLVVRGRGPAPAPLVVSPEALLSSRLGGRLVETTSTVVGAAGTSGEGLNVSLAAADSVLIVHMSREIAPRMPPLGKGATVRVRGIASQYDRSAPFDAGWQILPRGPADVVVVRPAPLFTARELLVGGAVVAATLGGTLVWIGLLRRQVRARTAQYREAADGAEAANRELRAAIAVKDDLVSILAHDFRSPLTLIHGYAEWLETSASDPEARRIGSVIRDRARQLSALVEDTMTMSRLDGEGFPLQRQPLVLSELVAEIVTARAAEGGGTLSFRAPDGPLRVEGDPERLREVVDNLVSNAVKFSPGGAQVQVAARRTGEGAEVEVADRGIGIAPEDLPRLFAKFSRLEAARERKIPGTGLGLYICRALVEAHGGRIWATSGDAGTTFRFVLPELGGAARGAGPGTT